MTIDPSAFKNLLSASPIQDYLHYLHSTILKETSGEVATYIPELANADPNWFGICIVTMDGHVYEVGDTRIPFTIQSISKPFVYGLALEEKGTAAVLKRVGVEPSGEAFNSISLREGTGQPFNPMINAGAIATTGQIKGGSREESFARIQSMFESYCGHELSVDESVFNSENETGHRNRAIAYMLRNFDILEDDPTPTLENYFRQCSLSVNCRDLAVIAGCLANSGINPLTGKRAVNSNYVENILSVMNTCGMYDYAGEWIYKVGMPAKSGVAGGILAVLPGQLGVGIFSPPLDERGNSVRGIQTCYQLSKDYNLHMLNVPNTVLSALRTSYTGSEVTSNRVRPNPERSILLEAAKCIKIFEFQGELHFSSTEMIIRKINDTLNEAEFLVLNLKRVLRMDQSACKLLYSLHLRLKGMNKKLIFTSSQNHSQLQEYMHENLGSKMPKELFIHSHTAGVEYCENLLLYSLVGSYGGKEQNDVFKNEFFEGLDEEGVKLVVSCASSCSFESEEQIIKSGDKADAVYILIKGSVRVGIVLPNGRFKRLAAFSAGVSFGELAVTQQHVRTADVYAECASECLILKVDALDEILVKHPVIGSKLLRNIISGSSARLGTANKMIAAIS